MTRTISSNTDFPIQAISCVTKTRRKIVISNDILRGTAKELTGPAGQCVGQHVSGIMTYPQPATTARNHHKSALW